MIPKRITGQTHAFGPPADWDAARQGTIATLAVRVEPAPAGTVYFVSAWEPTPGELERLNAGGSVMLRCLGGQPPVALSVELPAPYGGGDG